MDTNTKSALVGRNIHARSGWYSRSRFEVQRAEYALSAFADIAEELFDTAGLFDMPELTAETAEPAA